MNPCLLLVISLLASMGAPGSIEPPTKYFDEVMPGKLRYSMKPIGGPFKLGQPIMIEYVLRNIGTEVFEVCSSCVGESIRADLVPERLSFCVMSPSPEERPTFRSLKPNEAVSLRKDISACIDAEGQFELSDSYLQEYNTSDATVAGSICIRAAPVQITVIK